MFPGPDCQPVSPLDLAMSLMSPVIEEERRCNVRCLAPEDGQGSAPPGDAQLADPYTESDQRRAKVVIARVGSCTTLIHGSPDPPMAPGAEAEGVAQLCGKSPRRQRLDILAQCYLRRVQAWRTVSQDSRSLLREPLVMPGEPFRPRVDRTFHSRFEQQWGSGPDLALDRCGGTSESLDRVPKPLLRWNPIGMTFGIFGP